MRNKLLIPSENRFLAAFNIFYDFLLLIAVYLSSFLFAGLIIKIAIFKFFNQDVGLPYILLFCLVLVYFFTRKKQTKKVKKLGRQLGRIAVFTITLAVVIFIVSYFAGMTHYQNSVLIDYWNIIEAGIAKTVFAVLLFAFALLFYAYLSSFIINQLVKRKKGAWSAKLFILSILLTMIPFYFIFIRNFTPIFDFFYDKIGWVLGFSLFFLYANYLLSELMSLRKGSGAK